MSIISEQVKEILNMASVLHGEKRLAAEEIMRQAADTIEFLSAKLQAANMERSAGCGEWIPCKERLPEVEINENVKSGICTDNGERFLITDTEGYVYESIFWLSTQEFEDEAIAWMPKLEPYHES